MRSRRIYAAAVLAAGVVALAACSSGSSSTSTAATGTSASSGGSGAPTAATVSAAQAAVQALTTPPTSIPETQALPSAPPKGKTVLFLQCEESQCAYEGQGLQAAAKVIGWNVKVLNFQAANPATLVTALQQGLQYHPVMAFFSGVPQEAWNSEQKAYAAAGAVIVANYLSAAPSGTGVEAGRGYASENIKQGQVLAEEQVVNSGPTPTNSIIVTVPTYTVYVPMVTSYKAEIAKECSSCKVSELDITLPQMLGGNLVPAVVSAVKRAPGVKYVISVNGSFTAALPQALKAAGISGVTLISATGVATDQQNVLSGTQLATMSDPLIMGGWQDMDMAIRYVMHLPESTGDEQVPWIVLNKTNIGTPADSTDLPADYASQFEKLWNVG